MTEDVHKQNPGMDLAHTTHEDLTTHGDVDIMQSPSTLGEGGAVVWYIGDTDTLEQALSAVDPASLHYDQFQHQEKPIMP